nr:MAG TPA: hypothetical protein [Caudoviricetes sp.]
MSNIPYSDRAYINALYDSMERLYFNDIQHPAPNPIHYSFTVRADGISEDYREINKIRKKRGLVLVKPFASREDCLQGL